MSKQKIKNWGNYPVICSEVIDKQDFNELSSIILGLDKVITRGNGRCYGDSSLQNTVISTLKFNKILQIDTKIGFIHVESGIMLSEILEIIVPLGYFLPVTPGTKWITVGGAVASNIHGKNHHKEGSISNFILSFDLMTEEGIIVHCSRTENDALFIETIGGMGGTGIIVTVKLTLKPIETSYVKQQTIKANNLDEVLDLFDEFQHATYSVAWIDCLKKGKKMGRSLLMVGEHLKKNEFVQNKNQLRIHSNKQINVPFYLPNFTLNKLSIGLFNSLYFNKQRSKIKNSIVHYNTFFYPLDRVSNWNKIYGKNGFTQYQFVIPFDKGREGLRMILKEITNAGCASFLAVLKTFSNKDFNCSSLSFPMEGYSLTLDFKLTANVFLLLERLDKIVLEFNGRLYLSKDSRMSKDTFEKMYGTKHVKSKFKSLQFERLCN